MPPPGAFCRREAFLFPSRVLLFAVLAAVDLVLLVREHEDLVEALLDRGDAARVLAGDDVDDLLRELKAPLFDDLAVLDHVDRDIVVDEAEHVEIEIVDRALDLDDILAAHFFGAGVLDDSDRAVELAEIQVAVDRHGVAGLDVVEHDAFFQFADRQFGIRKIAFHSFTSRPSRVMIRAMRT